MATRTKRAESNGQAVEQQRRELILPPQNLEAENCTLGAILVSRGAVLDDVRETGLSQRHFYNDGNGEIFATCVEMADRGTPVDAVTLAEALEKRDRLNEVGGVIRVNELMEIVPHAVHGPYYAKLVVEAARRRDAIAVGRELMRAAYDPGEALDELLSDGENRLHAVMADSIVEKPKEIGEILGGLVDELTTGPRVTPFVPTGLSRLDQIVGGIPQCGIAILAARPSQGKSALAISIAHSVASTGRKVLIASYEQRVDEIAQRLLAIASGVSYHDLGRASGDPNVCDRIMQAAGEMEKLRVSIDCSLRNQTGLATLIRLAARKNIDLIIIDYLQLIDADDRKASREQQVAGITRTLKRTAMAVNVPLLVLSQLNREVEKRADQRPRLSDLRESGAIEQDADQVWLLYRPGSYQADRTDREGNPLPPISDDFGVLHVAKHRNGPTGELRLAWDAPTMHYTADPIDPFGGK